MHETAQLGYHKLLLFLNGQNIHIKQKMDSKNLEKKFILQKQVLDSMRVYLDLNQAFLEKLYERGIFTITEVTEIQVNYVWVFCSFSRYN